MTDLLNNSIGRAIGESTDGDVFDIVTAVLDIFHTDGLWIFMECSNGFSIERKTINDDDYKNAIEYLSQLKSNGYERQ